MVKRNVDIAIRARDQASKRFRRITGATNSLTGALKRAAGAAAVFFGTRALFRFGKQSLQLFGRQEEAVVSLADALENLGLPRVTKEYEEFAASIQEVTRLGDEQVLELQTMGATMAKLSGQSLKDATRASIGLAKAFKVDVVAAMRLVARAAIGDTSSLTRYGITLAKGLTVQEKFNAVLKIGSSNFNLAKGAALTFNGQMEQTGNIIGDVRELIGSKLAPTVLRSAKLIRDWATQNADNVGIWAERTVRFVGRVKDGISSLLLPVLTSTAVRIRDWAKENRENIGLWAQRSIDFVVDVKNSLVDFANFMKTDFSASMKVVWDNFLVIVKAAFDSAVILAAEGGRRAGNAFRAGVLGNEPSTPSQISAFKAEGGRTFKLGEAAKLIDPESIDPEAPSQSLATAKAVREQFTRISGIPGSGLSGEFVRKRDLERFRAFGEQDTGPSAFEGVSDIFSKAFEDVATRTRDAQAEVGIIQKRLTQRARRFESDPEFRGRRIAAAEARQDRPSDEFTRIAPIFGPPAGLTSPGEQVRSTGQVSIPGQTAIPSAPAAAAATRPVVQENKETNRLLRELVSLVQMQVSPMPGLGGTQLVVAQT